MNKRRLSLGAGELVSGRSKEFRRINAWLFSRRREKQGNDTSLHFNYLIKIYDHEIYDLI